MNFISLTRHEKGTKIWVNAEKIIKFFLVEDDVFTCIFLDDNNYVRVSEKPEEIITKILQNG